MQQSVLDPHPNAELSVTVVWSDWWPADGALTAQRSSSLIGPADARVAHFYEPGRLLGKVVAKSLGWDDPDNHDTAAWDIYLFYPAGVRWDDELPAPAIVHHQLGMRMDDSHFRTGDDLVAALREAAAATVKPAT